MEGVSRRNWLNVIKVGEVGQGCLSRENTGAWTVPFIFYSQQLRIVLNIPQKLSKNHLKILRGYSNDSFSLLVIMRMGKEG